MVQLLSDPATGTTATMDANTTTSTETTTTTTSNTTSHHVLWSSPALSPAAQKQRTRRGYSVIETPRSSEFILPHHFHHNQHAHHHNHNHNHHHHGHHHNPNSAVHTASSGQVSTQAAIPENAVLRTSPSTNNPSTALPPTAPAAGGKKKPPRRSYSATDKEPEEVLPSIGLPQPSAHLGILDMPSELHYTLFDFLDPIDAVCLGLAHSKLYYIHRRKHAASVPLSTRYSGPNDMEWAWRGVSQPGSRSASPALGAAATTSVSSPSPSPSPSPPPQQQQQQQQQTLDKLRVKGQVYCRKCGISRCELHRHLKSWMGDGYEYCEIKQRFGAPAATDAKNYCFMSSPKDRHRCGRHGGVKSASNATATAA